MKIKTISRLEADFKRNDSSGVIRTHRNPDPKLNPFERQKEYKRAVNAAKLNKIFARPFIASMEHNDGVVSMATSPKSLVSFATGAADGELKLWDLASRKLMWSAVAHAGFVRGISISADGESVVTCSDDKTVKYGTCTQAKSITMMSMRTRKKKTTNMQTGTLSEARAAKDCLQICIIAVRGRLQLVR